MRAEMEARGIGALILCDAVNIRYATGTRNTQVFTSRNAPSRYLLLIAGRSILYEFTGCEHLADGFDTVDEVREASTSSFVAAGARIVEREQTWVQEMSDTLRDELGAGSHVAGFERMNAGVANGMAAAGHQVVDAQEPIEMVRAIKSSGEVACISASLALTERAVSALRDAIRPGQTENELWAVLHHEVIAGNGDYCETRLLNAGPRSNPWFQESSHRVIEPNEVIALDTDVVGCHGYYADFSCTFHAGPDAPSVEQRRLYALAHGSCTTTSPSSSRG
ncbi:MAG: M24 family metallopeptidase [Acidimicrobiales bacterium]|nr:M24 family metallopeptidase [Acidimicrobiales bacterium]